MRSPGHRLIFLLLPLGLLLARPATCAAAQQPATTLPIRAGGALLGVPRLPESAEDRQVRISLDEHRLYVLERGRVVWSARIGTGTGEVLEGAGQVWDFATPPGRYRVQRKERDPVWILPDWHFVKRGEPIPPLNSPRRRLKGALGAAALYLTPEIAIHGTDQPELLGDAISHGCIRMSNEDVLRLHEELEVGTPVIIFGQESGG
jgi:lipoprotein-anchoring transpeptidase ErfK/SrfK